MKLSIITTVYNAEPYVQESLDSVFNQTFEDFELIIVDDCSTDKTNEILQKYKNHPKVIFLENEFNKGVSFSRNRALTVAKGEYIAIHDADDISLPYRFEKEVKYLDNHSEITVVGSHAFKIDINGKITGFMTYPPETTENARRVIKDFKLNPIIDSSSMFRKQTILDIGMYPEEKRFRTVQDFYLWCTLLAKGYKIHNFQEPLIKYRDNPNGVTKKRHFEQRLSTDIVWELFSNIFDKKGIEISFPNK